ncbi:MAG: hypothetical protein ACRDVL_00335 [Acidimicrobiia bacterium]
MTTVIVSASAGLVVAGPLGAMVGAALPWLASLLSRKRVRQPHTRLVLVILLVEVRSGVSILAALQAAAALLPDHRDLRRAARVATVSGLTSALSVASADLRPVLAQLARAQISGASISGTLRAMLEQDLARERAERIAVARSLPVRLMIPVTLLMLPGLVLLLYAPSLLRLFQDLTGSWT